MTKLVPPTSDDINKVKTNMPSKRDKASTLDDKGGLFVIRQLHKPLLNNSRAGWWARFKSSGFVYWWKVVLSIDNVREDRNG